MFRIVKAEFLAPEIKRFEILAPKIAAKRKAGQFVIVRISAKGERIPLTIADSSIDRGTITIIVQGIGKTTKEINTLQTDDFFLDVVGPLGLPSHIEKFGTAVSIGGGVGTAIAFPTAKALKDAGNHTISIIGGKTKEHVILEDEMNEICDEVYVTTDDGSYGYHGFVTGQLQELIDSGRKIDFVLAIGPIPMMNAVAEVTRKYGIKTVVSLNPVMVDGTGMCGGCRAVVGGKTVFVCVDGPEFDAHEVDFRLLMKRNNTYRNEEHDALERHICSLDKMYAEALKEEI
ncbi:MAG: sulfide/dihydroorotate dehydrogenase-like FAD/NAD-binding protein [Ignavibacteriales bacterium]|nr:MAG: sulfide/dihydroorotate dehydrogenase-like FAD/NAD-binding protein [Ignavibacteriaceae bacterium]MBW7873522.1 sulfide/dihydroorotate dehydrogenase-like FAD/NAD-binding protein [Ignavibacteria bacterium]MCZ2142213.1 sulfide/dihydroorotate dehydrogenase-like FAD/NAD-binding protein [Ignavibacteriales bacterium]OQY76102.1 MAG: ferredoxin-NADP reductase [Ignavibacteriales bacterium UTCHB3]MBV6444948.1 Dihydroorotate dehydrogenase B (NAD(+)), electron transfer subunit [Ignavibacteriaceae bact